MMTAPPRESKDSAALLCSLDRRLRDGRPTAALSSAAETVENQ